MSNLQDAMGLLLSTFQKYAEDDGKKDTLSKSEVKKLLEKELPEMLSGGKDQKKADDLIKALDTDGDNEVDFIEFMILVSSLTCILHDMFYDKKT